MTADMSIYPDIAELQRRHGQLGGAELVRAVAADLPGKVAVFSSFGAESVVLLDLVASIDPSIPVITLDTGMLFDETLEYMTTVSRRLGLREVRIFRPDRAKVQAADPDEELWRCNHDACCAVRKVEPMLKALTGFLAVIDGRKRLHGDARAQLEGIEDGGGFAKISPLATWSQEMIDAHFENRKLPRHPLTAKGYASIGCFTCTQPVKPGEPPRSGRWAGTAKTECGIHKTKNWHSPWA